jgi:hypothetical protein
MCTEFKLQNRKGNEHLGYIDIDRKIIRGMSRK